MNKKSIYFPGLNTIRFLAAFIVIINHVESNKKHLGLPNYCYVESINIMGRLGVILFFVLSGFLITYLLLVEKEKFNTIDIKKFYIRRILRIWPLYYLMLILSLFLLPNINGLEINHWLAKSEITFPLILFCIFFLPNWVLYAYPPIPYFAQAWSVGVEEQFYFMWPFLLKKFKNIFFLLLIIIATYLSIKLILFPIIKFKFHYWNSNIKNLKLFWDDFLIDTMAIGGLFAYAYFKQSKVLVFFYHPITQSIAYALMIYLFFTGIKIPYVKSEVFALLFGILILNVSTNKKAYSKWFNLPLFDYLGKISYGIYMYHTLCIVLTIKIMVKLNVFNNMWLYIISITTSIGISALSYEYFEKYFLARKSKFAKIQSTNTLKNMK